MSVPLTTLGPVCTLLRTKTAFGQLSTEGDDSEWHDGESTTAVYWCLKTMATSGPDDDFADPHCCRSGRTCYHPAEE